MSTRINIAKMAPGAYQAIMGLENYLSGTALTNTHKEMIKLRASQINQCAFCIDMHTADARKYGETEQRLYLLNAWREADIYTLEEKAILALTEEVTRISEHHVSDSVYDELRLYFDDKYIADAIVMIIAINAWNRIAISSGWRVS